MDKVICPYCSSEAVLVTGETIYPHRPDLFSKSFWYCDNGHSPAYGGCHKGTTTPLGTIADADTRKWRSKAHAVFDPMWKNKKVAKDTRWHLYGWLANKLGIRKADCHIGLFDIEMCKKVIEVCNERVHQTNTNE